MHSLYIHVLHRATPFQYALQQLGTDCLALSPCTGLQPLSLRQRPHAGQCFPPKVGRPEMAQHGKLELHEKINQTLEWRPIHVGDNQEGNQMDQPFQEI